MFGNVPLSESLGRAPTWDELMVVLPIIADLRNEDTKANLEFEGKQTEVIIEQLHAGFEATIKQIGELGKALSSAF